MLCFSSERLGGFRSIEYYLIVKPEPFKKFSCLVTVALVCSFHDLCDIPMPVNRVEHLFFVDLYDDEQILKHVRLINKDACGAGWK